MHRMLRLDMTTRQITETPLPREELLLGGRALTSRVVFQEVPPTCHPLGPRNKLVFAAGPLAGTLVSSANRLSIGGKSPLTGGIKESNAGGMVAYKLARLGIRALVIEGKPPAPGPWQVLVLDAQGARLEQAPAGFAGAGVYRKAHILAARHGRHAALALVGPAAEQMLLAAGIACTDPEGNPARYSGRGGLGAVLASKGILGLIVDDSSVPREALADAPAFASGLKRIAALVNGTPQTAEVFRKYGTAAMMVTTNTLGALPTRNFSRGTFEGASAIDGNALYETIVARGGQGDPSHACMRGCLIRCSNVFADKDGKAVVSPMEYENLGMLGSNCGIGDLDDIARLNHACNDMGVDTIDTGAALAVAMEAGLAPFGDAAFAEKAITGIARGEVLSKLIGSGAEITGKVLGQYRVPTAKGQSLAAYDPRGIKGTGATYATSPMGADHTAGNTPRAQIRHNDKTGQVELSANAQAGAALYDALGLCVMLMGAIKDPALFMDLVNARFGTAFTLEEARLMAARTLEQERAFNRNAGLGESADRIAEFFYVEENPDSRSIFDLTHADLTPITRGSLIPVTVESRLVWRKEPPRQVLIPQGTLVRDFLAALGEPELRDHALVAMGTAVCAPDRTILPGDALILLSVVSGG